MRKIVQISIFTMVLSLAASVPYYSARLARVRPAPGSQVPRPCDTLLGAKVGAVSFQVARRIFIQWGYSIAGARRVEKSSDLEGGIMYWGRVGKWLYVTKAELRYDPDQELLAYSRLEGVLNNGHRVSFNKTSMLPPSFQTIGDWTEIGRAFMVAMDGKVHKMAGLSLEVKPDGGIVRSDAAERSARRLSADDSVVCNARGGVNCTSLCPLGSCSFDGEDCHCSTAPLGLCLTSPGLACGGSCPDSDEGTTCKLVTPNPGSLFCDCTAFGDDDDDDEEDSLRGSRGRLRGQCLDDNGNVDPDCQAAVASLHKKASSRPN